MRKASLLLIALFLAGSTVPAAAQKITGKVIDSQGRPVADASVVLLDSRDRIQRGTLSEPDGSYELTCPGPGSYKVRVGGAGLDTWDSPPMKIEKDQTVEFEIRVASAGGAALETFERRRATREGVFLTTEQIAKLHSGRFTSIFEKVPGVDIVGLPADTARPGPGDRLVRPARDRRPVVEGVSTLRLAGSTAGAMTAGARQMGERLHDCPPELFVNGKWWGSIDQASDRGPDEAFAPQEVLAVEIYTPALVPDELKSRAEAEQCGVIVVWRK